MMAVRFSGLSVTAASVLLIAAGSVSAAEAPVMELPVMMPLVPPQAEAPYQVLREGEQKVRWLDPAQFTEISPLTVPDIAVKLPEDQQE